MSLFFRSNISLILFPSFEACLEAYYNSYRYSSKLTRAAICSKVPVNSIFKQRICLIVLTRFVDLLLERITTEHLICLKRNVRSFHSYQAYNSHVFSIFRSILVALCSRWIFQLQDMPFIDASEITARKNYILTINNFIPICKDLLTDGKIHMRSRERRRGVQF